MWTYVIIHTIIVHNVFPIWFFGVTSPATCPQQNRGHISLLLLDCNIIYKDFIAYKNNHLLLNLPGTGWKHCSSEERGREGKREGGRQIGRENVPSSNNSYSYRENCLFQFFYTEIWVHFLVSIGNHSSKALQQKPASVLSLWIPWINYYFPSLRHITLFPSPKPICRS